MAFWKQVGALPFIIDQNSMIKLPDGRVLSVGGNTAGGCVADCALYDPATRVWEAVDSLPVAKENSMLVVLDDGQVLAAGGDTGGYANPTANCVIFNPVTKQWTATGSLAIARFNSGVYKLPNGQVLVAGGTITNLEGSTDTCELYDPALGTWSSAASMSSDHAMANYAMMGDTAIIIGGKDGTADASTVVEAYDYIGDSWSTKTAIPVAGTFNDGFNNCVILKSGKLLHVGGRTSGTWASASGNETGNCAEFDLGGNSWQTVASLAQKRDEHEVWLLHDGRVMVTGGFTTNDTVFLSSVEIYDPLTQTWSAGEVRPHVIAATNPMGGVVLNDGSPITAGGFYAGPAVVTDETYLFTQVVDTQLSGNQIKDGIIDPKHLSNESLDLITDIAIENGGGGGGSGKLLQLVEAHFGSATTTSSGSFVDTTTTAAITVVSGSRVKISVTGSLYTATLNAAQEVYFTVTRNGTNIGHAATGLISLTPAGRYDSIAFTVLDATPSVGANTYIVQMYTDGGRTIVFPGNGGSHSSHIILEEIGA